MGVNNIPSVIDNIDPDVMLEDGTLYYYPFKLVPVVNLIKQMDKNSEEFKYDNEEKPLELMWVAKTGSDHSAIVFKVFEDTKEKYIPVGDLVISGPNDATNYLNNDYFKLLNSFEKNTNLLSVYVLYVKDDMFSSKILKDEDFVPIDDDAGSGNYSDLSIWAAESRNLKNGEQQTEGYIILSDVVGKHYSQPLGLNSTPRRRIAAVNKNYFSKINDYKWEKETGIADWNGIHNSEYISYSSPFANTFFADGISSGNGRYYLVEKDSAKFDPVVAAGASAATVVALASLGPIGLAAGLAVGLGLGLAKEKTYIHVRNPINFFDIRPLSVTRVCCSGLITDKLSSYCTNFNDQEVGNVQCISNMNDYCKGDNLKSDECIAWCKKDGNYCDTSLIDYCKKKDLSLVNSRQPSPSPSATISYSKLKSANLAEGAVNKKNSYVNSSEEKCKQKCTENNDCDACTFNASSKTCNIYESKEQASLKSTFKYSENDRTFFKDKVKSPDPREDMKICACFKDNNFYTTYFDKATGTYPEEIKNLITLTAGTRDKRCYYPECANPDNIKNRTLKQNPGQCGDQSLQVCFENIKTDENGADISGSDVENKQRLSCVNNVENITGKSVSQQAKNELNQDTFSCSDNYTCIMSKGGAYSNKSDCEKKCTKTEVGSSTVNKRYIIYAIIAAIVIFFMLIITILLIK